jgi:DNA-binding CsgD family transcriptional regulator
MNSHKLLLRGFADLALENALGLQAHWDLEFDIEEQDYYGTLQNSYRANSTLPLSRFYYWHFIDSLKFTGEKSLLCSIPIISPEGLFMGVCGFEISPINFSLYNTPQQKSYPRLFSLLARGDDGSVNFEEALFAGNTVLPKGDAIITEGGNGLSTFRTERPPVKLSPTGFSFTGRHSVLPLYREDSPYDGQFVLALVMPGQDYNGYIWESNIRLAVILSVFLALGTVLSILVIRRYLRRTALKKKAPTLEDLGLSPREKEICLLLLQAYSLKQIGYELKISFSTVNTHYQSLYRKLGISSKAELFMKFGL